MTNLIAWSHFPIARNCWLGIIIPQNICWFQRPSLCAYFLFNFASLQDAIVANTFGRSRSCFLYDVRPSCLCIQYREYSFGVAWTSDKLQQYWSKILFGSLMQCYWSSRCGLPMLLIVRPVRALRLPIVLFKQRTQSFFTSGSTWIITDQTCDKLERKKIQNGPDP